ncbi:MAG: cell division topological specificity factor MinE [Chloroflexota bacterium]
MPEFLDRILGRAPAKKTGTVAKERLQFILVHDRINLPPERMEAMKREILEVIAKYVSVDNENVEIALQKRQDRGSILVAEIPFLKTLEATEFEDDDDKSFGSAMLSDKTPADDSPPSSLNDDEPAPDNPPPPEDTLSAAHTQPVSEPPAASGKPKSTYAPKRKR